MVIKVQVYVNIDSKGIQPDILPEISQVLNEVFTEHLKTKFPKSKRTLKTWDEDGELLVENPFEIVTRREAIERFR